MKKARRYLGILLMILFMILLSLSGCGKASDTEKEGYHIYYQNMNHTGLNSYHINIEETDKDSVIRTLWNEMCRPSEGQDQQSVVPSDVVLLKWVFSGSNLSVYFNTAYQNMDSVSELLFRAAIVYCFTDVEGVESVTFFVDETTLMDASYVPLGAQTEENYVELISNELSSTRKTQLVLYFTDESGEHLETVTKEIVYENTYSLEMDVLKRLIQGPSAKGLYRTLPDNLQVISINVKNGTCYINFDSSFLTDALPIDGNVIVYSIVNSLCELSDISSVQIMVNGDSDVTIKNISLDKPLTRSYE